MSHIAIIEGRGVIIVDDVSNDGLGYHNRLRDVIKSFGASFVLLRLWLEPEQVFPTDEGVRKK